MSDLKKLFGPEKLKSMGRELYSKQEYHEALDAFNAALETQRKPDIQLLDFRAATYEKLGNYQAALKDARQMLVLDKSHVLGYLRTGKVLQRLEKADLALQIYQRGLRLTSSQDPHYQALHDVSLKLSRELMKGTDFLLKLPIELIEMVFSYVAFDSLCKCLYVCKAWHQFLSSQSFLWTHIDFSSARRNVDRKTLFVYLQYSRGRACRLTLKGVHIQGNKIIQQVVRGSPKLQSLKILSGGMLSESLTVGLQKASSLKILHLSRNTSIFISSVHMLLLACPSLEQFVATFVDGFDRMDHERQTQQNDLTNLKLLSLGIASAYQVIDILRLLPAAPNLVSLDLSKNSHGGVILDFSNDPKFLQSLTKLEQLRFNKITTISLYLPPPNLRVLDLGSSVVECQFFRNLGEAPSLTEISLWGPDHDLPFTDLLGRLLDSKLPNASFITKLHIATDFLNEGDVMNLLGLYRVQKLVELDWCVPCNPSLSDAIVPSIIKIKTLRRVHLTASSITGVGVKMLQQGLRELHFLDVTRCRMLSADAVEWARSQGIQVAYSAI